MNNNKSMKNTKWQKAQTCDLCHRPVAWEHQDGGKRCNKCPRPENTEEIIASINYAIATGCMGFMPRHYFEKSNITDCCKLCSFYRDTIVEQSRLHIED
jgi:hypothetical protein